MDKDLLARKLYSERVSALLGDHEINEELLNEICLLYTSPSPRDGTKSRMPSSA